MTGNEKAKGVTTEYMVLELVERDGIDDLPAIEAWLERGAAVGTETQAVDKVVGNEVGTFKAVAGRSWKGSITRVQQTVIKTTRAT